MFWLCLLIKGSRELWHRLLSEIDQSETFIAIFISLERTIYSLEKDGKQTRKLWNERFMNLVFLIFFRCWKSFARSLLRMVTWKLIHWLHKTWNPQLELLSSIPMMAKWILKQRQNKPESFKFNNLHFQKERHTKVYTFPLGKRSVRAEEKLLGSVGNAMKLLTKKLRLIIHLEKWRSRGKITPRKLKEVSLKTVMMRDLCLL